MYIKCYTHNLISLKGCIKKCCFIGYSKIYTDTSALKDMIKDNAKKFITE